MCRVYHGCAENLGPQKKWPPSCHREPESPKSPKNIEDDVICCACAVHWLGMRSSWRPNPAATTIKKQESVYNMSRIMRKPVFEYAKTKAPISCAVTVQLTSDFVFATKIEQPMYFLNLKFQASNHILWL